MTGPGYIIQYTEVKEVNVNHHLTKNTRYLRSLAHNIIKVIQLFKNYGFCQLFKHRPMR